MTNSGSFFIVGYRSLIIVILLLIVTRMNSQSFPEPTCKIEAKSADCSASTDVVVIPPTKLPVELKVMNLSSNKVIQFNAKNMKRYKQLNRLYLKNVYFENNEITSNQNWFVDLISLEELDMTGTDFRIDGDKNPYTLNCRWPARLKKLILSDMGIDNIAHLSSLKELEYLDVSKNYFAVFPAIDSNAPLKYLILAKNPLANITISHVAAFCELISLDLQSMILHPTFGSLDSILNYFYL